MIWEGSFGGLYCRSYLAPLANPWSGIVPEILDIAAYQRTSLSLSVFCLLSLFLIRCGFATRTLFLFNCLFRLPPKPTAVTFGGFRRGPASLGSREAIWYQVAYERNIHAYDSQSKDIHGSMLGAVFFDTPPKKAALHLITRQDLNGITPGRRLRLRVISLLAGNSLALSLV